ncbi:VipE [Legionella quinlivanii]|uniref:VipE n=1 Tax=Legionella quinlivanii TaxID=45073 RepID=A0A0W0Y088_9GAMM|nr:hypothetical protein [Legionella quinlivanii]KTD50449.1 VipE [Legionella quinlivanii]SEF39968.1 hypothetical protein SAMN02746093_00049 [Legionella quinlivanii DSM 21216]STY12049.1 VipE [Legionella quinlivanii]
MANGITKPAKAARKKSGNFWEPMQHTRSIVQRWHKQLLSADFSIEDIKRLENEILQDSRFHPIDLSSNEKITYSDSAYTQKEAMIDFVLAVCPYLSLHGLHQLTSLALTKEINTIDNTFLRNNELARYLLVYEAGIYASKPSELEAMLLSQFKEIAGYFSEEGWFNVINHSILQTLSNLKRDYAGFEALYLSEGVSPEMIHRLKQAGSEVPLFKPEQDQPELPEWFHPQEERKCHRKLRFFGFRDKEVSQSYSPNPQSASRLD